MLWEAPPLSDANVASLEANPIFSYSLQMSSVVPAQAWVFQLNDPISPSFAP